jgi:hypothetical protein
VAGTASAESRPVQPSTRTKISADRISAVSTPRSACDSGVGDERARSSRVLQPPRPPEHRWCSQNGVEPIPWGWASGNFSHTASSVMCLERFSSRCTSAQSGCTLPGWLAAARPTGPPPCLPGRVADASQSRPCPHGPGRHGPWSWSDPGRGRCRPHCLALPPPSCLREEEVSAHFKRRRQPRPIRSDSPETSGRLAPGIRSESTGSADLGCYARHGGREA